MYIYCWYYLKWAYSIFFGCIFRFEKDWAQAKPSPTDRTQVSLAEAVMEALLTWINWSISKLFEHSLPLLIPRLCSLITFVAFRYFEEFEKRIPRAEMEEMEVMKHLNFAAIIRFLLFWLSSMLSVCLSAGCMPLFYLDSNPWRAEADRHRIHWNHLWKLQERWNFVIHSSLNSGNHDSDSHARNVQVLHRVVILIFCWLIQTTPLRLRSRYSFWLLGFADLVVNAVCCHCWQLSLS